MYNKVVPGTTWFGLVADRVYVNITPCTPIDRSVATQQSGSDRITVYMSTSTVREDEYGNQRLDLPANALGKDNH